MPSEKVVSCLGAVALLISAGCAAQSSPILPPAGPTVIPLTIQAGVPLHVVLDKSVRVKHAGAPIEGRVLEPIYVFDRKVIPAGSEIQGRVTKVEPVSRKRRLQALARGNFTPSHKTVIEFNTLRLKDGKQMPIETVVSPGAARVVHLVAGGNHKKEGRVGRRVTEARQALKQQEQQTLDAFRAPAKLKRLEAMFSAELPYHRQFLAKGTSFAAELVRPLKLGTADCPSKELARMGSEIPPGSLVHVRLATPLSSATSHEGSPVEAIVSRPVFSSSHQLILPEGSRLDGVVTEATPARRLGRNGKLRFTFRRIELPRGSTREIEAGLQAADVSSAAHLKLDAEGGAHATSSKTKYIMPAIDVLLASSSIDGDSGQRAIQEGTGSAGELTGGAVRGGVGFGLVGSALALAARSQPVSAAFAFYGAAWSIYSHLMARGSEVVFPKDTAMEIRFGSHEGGTSMERKRKRTSSHKPGHSS